MTNTETVERVWQGAQLLEAYLVPVESLIDHEKNARKGDVLALVASLERFGQVRPILIDGDTIVAGHHLRKAAVEMGWTHIAVIPHKFESDADRDAYLLADNQLAALGGYDQQAQMTFLDAMMEEGNLGGTGWTADRVDDLRAALEVREEAPAEAWGGGGGESEAERAARAAALANYKPSREIPMMIEEAYVETFITIWKGLSAKFETSGMTATILRTMEDAADRYEIAYSPAVPEERTEVVEPVAEHNVTITIGDFRVEGEDPDAAYACWLQCECGWEAFAIHGQEAETLKAEHVG